MNTRRKVVKTVYKDAESDGSESGDFSASASEAEIPDGESSEEGSEDSAEDFEESPSKAKRAPTAVVRHKQKFAKRFLSRLTQQTACVDEEDAAEVPAFSVKDLSEKDKLLPAVLNLSESDSSDDEERPAARVSPAGSPIPSTSAGAHNPPSPTSDSDGEAPATYTDVWSRNVQESSEEVAMKSFQQLQQHSAMLQETRASVARYSGAHAQAAGGGADVRELLALGEPAEVRAERAARRRGSSGSEVDDWEEVKDAKPLPKSGIQLIVDFPGVTAKKTKQLDVEMMMRRKINRVKKEYQEYMHKVHLLCWLGHGNYLNAVLNDQDIMASALSLLPREKCYPSERVDIGYLIEITQWFRDKMVIKPDKHENKFKPNAPPLKQILLKQIKNLVVTSSKFLCCIFVSMLRALGIQCRIMLNFVTVPIRPPSSELCSLSTKHQTKPDNEPMISKTVESTTKSKPKPKKTFQTKAKLSSKPSKISQLDGNFDSCSTMDCSEDDEDTIMQLDGNDDGNICKINKKGANTSNSKDAIDKSDNEGVSPPKRNKKGPASNRGKTPNIESSTNDICLNQIGVDKINDGATKKNPQKKNVTGNLSETSEIVTKSKINKVSKNYTEKHNPEPKRSRRKMPNVENTTNKGSHKQIGTDNAISLKGNRTNKINAAEINPHKIKLESLNSDDITSLLEAGDNKTINKINKNPTNCTEKDKKITSKSVPNRSRSKTPNAETKKVKLIEAENKKTLKQKTQTKKDGTEVKPEIVKLEPNVSSDFSKSVENYPTHSTIKVIPKKNVKIHEKYSANVPEPNNCHSVSSESDVAPNIVSKMHVLANEKKILKKAVYTKSETAKKDNKKSTRSVKLSQEQCKSGKYEHQQVNVKSQSKNKSEHVSSDFFKESDTTSKEKVPKIIVTSADNMKRAAKENKSISRKRSRTSSPGNTEQSGSSKSNPEPNNLSLKKSARTRTRSAPIKTVEKETSKYFKTTPEEKNPIKTVQRVSHRDLLASSSNKSSSKKPAELDVKKDLVGLIKGRIKEAKSDTKKKKVSMGKAKEESDDSDYLPEEPMRRESAEDFKEAKISPKTKSRKVDRRVLSSDEDCARKKSGIDVWCEVFVEEIEQWVSVDIFKPQVHCASEIYSRATHPVSYVVGWDNGGRLKDLTRRYVPHWNTTTRRLRAHPAWWEAALQPWQGRAGPRDREEDDQLDKMMCDAPLPKTISEYKNHPLYALQRHLLKFEALYPADAAPLGFVRGEAVHARAHVHTCRSRDTWLKEAKTVRPGELPYKVVKARPKWDKLSNRAITDIPLEVFGPWQVEDYVPPTAEGGLVPRNAYGNVELFKPCMLPGGTVHVKLPGLNKTARKLNIDCAPAMTGFDFHGGWTHPVFDGFVVCSEFVELLTDAWVKDQEEMERREREKVEARVYGHWKRLIKGLLIRERLRDKYAFGDGTAAGAGAGAGGRRGARAPRLLVKK